MTPVRCETVRYVATLYRVRLQGALFCANMIIEGAFRPIVSKKESWALGQNQASKTAAEQ